MYNTKLNQRQIGSCYEDVAAAFLEQQGYQIRTRNYSCRGGEIDLVAADEEYLVFAEVKYRGRGTLYSGSSAVDAGKQYRLYKAARRFLYSHGYPEDTPCRMDVIDIEEDEPLVLDENCYAVKFRNRRLWLHWLKDAFGGM